MRQLFADGTYYALVDYTGSYLFNAYIDANKGFCIIVGEIWHDEATMGAWTTLINTRQLLDIGYGKNNYNTRTDYRLVFNEKKEVVKAIFEVLR